MSEITEEIKLVLITEIRPMKKFLHNEKEYVRLALCNRPGQIAAQQCFGRGEWEYFPDSTKVESC